MPPPITHDVPLRLIAASVLVFAACSLVATAQPETTPPPISFPAPAASAASAEPGPSAPPPAAATPPEPAPIVPAGVIPANLSISVTGAPAEPAFLEAQIRGALNRAIRPTLQPGAGLTYGSFVPWPLVPLRAGARLAVNVAVTITNGASSTGLSGMTTVTVEVVERPLPPPKVLFLSDDPEYLLSEGLILRRTVPSATPSRLYYYHSDIGVPRDLDVVLTAAVPTRVLLAASESGPDQDVITVGHVVSRDLLRWELEGNALLADVQPGQPFVVRHALLLQGELVAGAVDLGVVDGGPVDVDVVASAAGGSAAALLAGPRVPYDGHNRHGTFDLTDFGTRSETYVAGGPPVAVRLGTRSPSPRNVDPNDPGRDYGDYGVVQRITFTASNPGPAPQLMYLYAKPLGGPARGTFVVDGSFHELGCARVPQPYWIATYQLAPGSTAASTTVTMTDGGSYYPVEYGVTSIPPQPYTPPLGSPDGCSPVAPGS